jgi:dihydroxy-acid dehydratase
LAEAVKRGIRRAGGTPMEFGTISVSDGVAMGTEGMKASLISREIIADSIELVSAGHSFDGIVCLTGCDKTSPGAAMALGRLNIPGLVLYNGTILPGTYKGKDVTVPASTASPPQTPTRSPPLSARARSPWSWCART